MKTDTKKTTRATAALDRLMAGRKRQKIVAQVGGRAAEQWQELKDLGTSIGIQTDDVMALLLHLGYNLLLRELLRRLKASQATPAAKS